jgi:hypothetical protein
MCLLYLGLSWTELDLRGHRVGTTLAGGQDPITAYITKVFPLAPIGREEAGSHRYSYQVFSVQGEGRENSLVMGKLS